MDKEVNKMTKEVKATNTEFTSIAQAITENTKTEKECGEKHTKRVGRATLEFAVDISTDFNCTNN
jgi:hypothetical protein